MGQCINCIYMYVNANQVLIVCVCVCVCVEEGAVAFVSLRQVFHCMDKASFQYLATHILKGNQVIVRGNSVTMVTSLINILKVSIISHYELITRNKVNIPLPSPPRTLFQRSVARWLGSVNRTKSHSSAIF